MRFLLPMVLLVGCHEFSSSRDSANINLGGPAQGCDDPFVYYVDDDFDGYGRTADRIESCVELVAGNALKSGDCDDDDRGTFPGAIEVCDGVDRDCDGIIDKGAVDAPIWHPDEDGDGFAEANSQGAIQACERPDGYALGSRADDCDDSNKLIYPGAPDAACDGIDQDCSGGNDDEVAQIQGKSYSSLQAALLAYAADQHLWVCAGEHLVTPTVHNSGLLMSGVGSKEDVLIVGIGGRILDVSGQTLVLRHLTLQNGDAPGEDGGALRARVHTAELSDLAFWHNRAGGRGGAVFVELIDDRTSVVTMNNIDARYNQASGDGGFAAVRLGGVPWLEATDLQLHHNQSGASGGALRVTGPGHTQELVLKNIVASNNIAVRDGGTFSLSGTKHAVMVAKVLHIDGGSAARGGQIFVDTPTDNKVVLSDSVLRGGTATIAGGLIYQRGPGTFDSGLADVELADGSAPSGGLYWIELRNTGHLDWLGADLHHGAAKTGAAVFITGSSRPFDGQLDRVSLRDNVGGPAFQIDPDFADSIDTTLSFSDAILHRNRGGAVSVPSHILVDFERTDPGAGVNDNTGFDLRQGVREFSWSAPITLDCEKGVCE